MEATEPGGDSEDWGTDPLSVPEKLNDCGFVALLLCASVSLSEIRCLLHRINPQTVEQLRAFPGAWC